MGIAVSGLTPAGAHYPGARFRHVPDIRDYGAKFDGATDDTAALNAAIVDGWAEGSGALLPAGVICATNIVLPTGHVGDATNVTSSCLFRGAGRITPYGGVLTAYRNRGTILQQIATDGSDFITAGTGLTMTGGLMQPLYGFEDLTVLGPDINKGYPLANPVSGSGIKLGNASLNVFVPQPWFKNVYIAGFRGLKAQTAAISGMTTTTATFTAGRPTLSPKRDMLLTLTGDAHVQTAAVKRVDHNGVITFWTPVVVDTTVTATWNDPCAAVWLSNCEDYQDIGLVVQECAVGIRADNQTNCASHIGTRVELCDYFGMILEGKSVSHVFVQPTFQSNHGPAAFCDNIQNLDFTAPHGENNYSSISSYALAAAPATGQKICTTAVAAPAWAHGHSVTLFGSADGTAEATEVLLVDTVVGSTVTFQTNILNPGHTGIADTALGISPYSWIVDAQSGTVIRHEFSGFVGVGSNARFSFTGDGTNQGNDIWFERATISGSVNPTFYFDQFQNGVQIRACNPGQVADGSVVRGGTQAIVIDHLGIETGRVEAVLPIGNLGAAYTLAPVASYARYTATNDQALSTITLPPKGAGKSGSIQVTHSVLNNAVAFATADGATIQYAGGAGLIQSSAAGSKDVFDYECLDGAIWLITTRGLAFA